MAASWGGAIQGLPVVATLWVGWSSGQARVIDIDKSLEREK
jgi:hypothetical protein